MSSHAFANIGLLVTNDPHLDNGLLGIRKDAVLVVENGRVLAVADEVPQGVDGVTDVEGRSVVPGFVDSHTHLIFAGDRADEFAARSRGERYSAGGIRNTVAATRSASDEVLRFNAQSLLNEALRHGTTTAEIKSGYGLTVRDEMRSLEIASEFTDETTLLAAHVVPQEYSDNPDAYVDLITKEMIPHSRAKWVDVFSDTGAFSLDHTRRILQAGKNAGKLLRIHANQLTRTDAVHLAIELGVASADHLSQSSDEDIEALGSSDVVATLLPGAEFSTHSEVGLGRRFLDAGATVAIASDCNPGSSYTTSMPFCIAAAVSLLGFSVEEALYAATHGAARSLRRNDIGALSIGARADFAVVDAPSYIHLAYRPGVNLIHSTYKSGREVTTWLK